MTKRAVIVIGDVMLDEYIECDVTRIDQTAPVPVCRVRSTFHSLGGAANVAANIVALGVHTVLIGAVAKHKDDQTLKHLIEYKSLCSAKFDFRPVTARGNYTAPIKTRLIDSRGQLIIRLDAELTPTWDATKKTIKKFDSVCEEYTPEIVVVADYDKGFLTPAVLRHVISRSSQLGIFVIVDPVATRSSLYDGACIVTPNFDEALQIAERDETWCSRGLAEYVRIACNSQAAVVTCGKDGALLAWPACYEEGHYIPTNKVTVADTTGAGDSLVAGIAAKLFEDREDLCGAVKYGVAAATIAVQSHGTTVVGKHEVYRASINKPDDKIIQVSRAAELMQTVHWNTGELPVVTNGVFDLLHPGHCALLDWAATQGLFFTVLINSDESARELKGQGRPVQDEFTRASMVARHAGVDAVCIFNGPTPRDALQKFGMCHLVKGPDYTIDQVIDRDIVTNAGGSVKIMPKGNPTDAISTTWVLDRMEYGSKEAT